MPLGNLSNVYFLAISSFSLNADRPALVFFFFLKKKSQLECIACGNAWYASRDEAASLTIDGPNFARSVGTEPLATAKFEDVEKKLTSPRRSDKGGASDILKKSTEAYMPVLDSQRSFNKIKAEDNATTSNAD